MKKQPDPKALFGEAVWISPSYPTASPVIRRSFAVDGTVKEAKLHITGLGYFEAKINGKSITVDRLIPPASDYKRRPFKTVTYPVNDEFTHRIYYAATGKWRAQRGAVLPH